MQDYLGDVLEALRWPGETNVNFEVEENGKTVYLDVDLPEIEDFPKRPLQSRLGLQAKDESLGLRTAGTTYFIYVGLRSAIEPARMQTTGPKSLTNTPGNRNAKTRRFKSAAQARRFLCVHGPIHNLFRVGRHHLKAVHHRFLRE